MDGQRRADRRRDALVVNLAGPLGRAVLGRRVPKADPYLAFLAHIQAKESPSARTWAGGPALGTNIVTASSTGLGSMFGTPWIDYFWVSSIVGRIVQHAVSSEAQFNAIVANERAVWFRTTDAGSQLIYRALDRNGYASNAEDDGVADPSYYCNEIIWWDETLGARTRNPSIGGAEAAYTSY